MGFCGGGTSSQQTNTPVWFDPLGPNAKGQHGSTGGPEYRSRIFAELPGATNRAQARGSRVASRASAAAADPAWGQARNLASATLAGEYLNGNPYLDASLNATRRRSMADLRGSQAGLRDKYNRSGMTWSTGNQQAADSSEADLLARLAEAEAAQRQANYQFERGMQVQAPGMLDAAMSTPLNYLSSTTNAELAPMATEAQIVQALAGGGPVGNIGNTIVQKPSTWDSITSGIASA